MKIIAAAGRDRFIVEMTQDEIALNSHQRVAVPEEVISEIYDLLGISDRAANNVTSVMHIMICWLHTATERKQLLPRLIGVWFQRLFELSHGRRACQINLSLKCFEYGIGQRVTQPPNLLREFPCPTTVLITLGSRGLPSFNEVRTERSKALRSLFSAVGNGTGPLQLNPHRITMMPTCLLNLFGDIGERRECDDCSYQPTQCRYPFTQTQFIWSAQGFVCEHACNQKDAEEHADGNRHNPAHPVSRKVLRTFHSFTPAKSGRRLFRESGKRNAAQHRAPTVSVASERRNVGV